MSIFIIVNVKDAVIKASIKNQNRASNLINLGLTNKGYVVINMGIRGPCGHTVDKIDGKLKI